MSESKQHQILRDKLKKRFSKKKRLIIIIILIILVCVIVGYFVFMFFQKSSIDQQNKKTEEINKLVNNAQVYENTGKIDDAKNAYDKAINETSDKQQKANFLISKAVAILNTGDNDGALSVALESEGIIQSNNTASLIAQIYEKKGDIQKAIEYYQKAVSLTDKLNYLNERELIYYQRKIELLKGII